MLISTNNKKKTQKGNWNPSTKPIVLVGLMGAGKSSVGRLVAKKLDLHFFDADNEIELAADCSIREIFEKYGEEAFRNCERRVISRLIKQTSCVIATGGGAFLNSETRELIEKNAISIWLKANLETLIQRTKGRRTRPLLNVKRPEEVLAELMELRHPIYQEANITIITNSNKKNITSNKVIEAVKKYYSKYEKPHQVNDREML
tara:strand:+ start:88 stop:699 length:612 start_codon:yes stop_codon:yes gene_type:complete